MHHSGTSHWATSDQLSQVQGIIPARHTEQQWPAIPGTGHHSCTSYWATSDQLSQGQGIIPARHTKQPGTRYPRDRASFRHVILRNQWPAIPGTGHHSDTSFCATSDQLSQGQGINPASLTEQPVTSYPRNRASFWHIILSIQWPAILGTGHHSVTSYWATIDQLSQGQGAILAHPSEKQVTSYPRDWASFRHVILSNHWPKISQGQGIILARHTEQPVTSYPRDWA